MDDAPTIIADDDVLYRRLVDGGPRSLGFEVRHDPVPGNDAHTLIVGENSNALCKQLARLVRILPGVRSSGPEM